MYKKSEEIINLVKEAIAEEKKHDDLAFLLLTSKSLKVNQNSIVKARLFSIAIMPYHLLPF